MFFLSPSHLTTKFCLGKLGLTWKWTLTRIIRLFESYNATRVNLSGSIIHGLLLTLCFLVVANHINVRIEEVLVADLHSYLTIFGSLFCCSHLQIFFEILKRVVFQT